VAMTWNAAMMRDFLGHREAHDAILRAIEKALKDGPRTADLGGTADTTGVGVALAELVAGGV
jgi:tartrate dehydrogenase/decarboxylase / D-malate dehydrogenase